MAEKDVDNKKVDDAPKGDKEKKPEEKMIPKKRLDQVIAERDAEKARVAELTSAQEAAAAEALKEQGKYKELYEAKLKEAQEAQAALETVRVESVKKEVAREAGYPQLWDRVSGQTEDEVKADMALLVAALPQQKAPDIDGGTSSGKRTADNDGKIKLSEQNKSYLAGVLGVSPQYLPDEVDY